MNYKFFPLVLVRTPLYSFDRYHTVNYRQLLKDDQFKLALFLASKALFAELEKKDFIYELLTEKQKQTVTKYFNRASYRSTPFGLFSAFSVAEWGSSFPSKMILSPFVEPYLRADFSILVKMGETLLNNWPPRHTKFRPNQSLYENGTDFRYIRPAIDNEGQTTFSMVSVVKNPFLKKLLRFCAHGKTAEDIVSFIILETAESRDAADDFTRRLYSEKIITPDIDPNLTGEDYADRLYHHFNKEINGKVDTLLSGLLRLGESNTVQLNTIVAMAENISSSLCIADKQQNVFYAMAERNKIYGELPETYQTQILEGVHCLVNLSKSSVPDELNKFKTHFKSRYETREVPLLEVMDPQFGIGYGEFDEIKDEYDFRNTNYREFPEKDSSVKEEWKDLASVLLNEWHLKNRYNGETVIEITDERIKQVNSQHRNDHLPPSISVMFRIVEGKVLIENAGGCSALSLLGRFSCSKNVYKYAKDMAKQEQNMNRGVVFTEIAHACNLHAANINRRAHIREYEIPVLTGSGIDESKQVQLADIMVSIEEDSVVLRSKKLRKRIIPRLASAYNYTKSVFPVFRFLCDIQYQHLHADFSFSLSSLVPGLGFYPRIQYKSCILQLAEWHLETTDLNFLKGRPAGEQLMLFREFAGVNNYPRYFAYTSYDNFLVFDMSRDEDIALFLNEVRKKELAVIKEFPFTSGENLVEDTEGNPLLAQYVASLYLDREVYKTVRKSNSGVKSSIRSKTTDEWLYFKIYCHPLSADIILCDHLLPAIQKNTANGNIKEWFWVRYNDPDYHIRLRIKPAKKGIGPMFEIVNKQLNKLCSARLIRNFQTDIYRQELERYSAELMPFVELVFRSSSETIADFLKKKQSLQLSDDAVLTEAVVSLREMLLHFEFSPSAKIEFCKTQFEYFYKEFGCPKALKSKIETLHKRLHADINKINIEERNSPAYMNLKIAIARLFHAFHEKKVKKVNITKLAADIIHMHINRLFAYQQRYFEMVIYYLLYRMLVSQNYIERSITSPL